MDGNWNGTGEQQLQDVSLVMLLSIAFTLIIHRSRRGPRRRPVRDSALSGHAWTQELLSGHPRRAQENFRMEVGVFKRLVRLLRMPNGNRPGLCDTRGVTVEEQALMFMQWVRQSSSNRTLQERFQHSGETVHRHVHAVLDSLYYLAPEFIKPPTTPYPVPDRIIDGGGAKFYPWFRHCIGALDGTHIPVFIPEQDQNPYQNRKGYLSQNVLGVCNFEGLFTWIHAGWEGSANDGIVLDDAQAKGFHIPEGKFYLADAGYGIAEGILTPYRGIRYHLKEWGRANQR